MRVSFKCIKFETIAVADMLCKLYRRLALSTNNIDRIGSLAGLSNLKILSLGRNLIKKVLLSVVYIGYNSQSKLLLMLYDCVYRLKNWKMWLVH